MVGQGIAHLKPTSKTLNELPARTHGQANEKVEEEGDGEANEEVNGYAKEYDDAILCVEYAAAGRHPVLTLFFFGRVSTRKESSQKIILLICCTNLGRYRGIVRNLSVFIVDLEKSIAKVAKGSYISLLCPSKDCVQSFKTME